MYSSARDYDSWLGATLASVNRMDGSRGLAEELIPLKTKVSCHSRGVNSPNYLNIYQVLDRTKVLHGSRTQIYGETNYLEEKSSFGQNQGIAWSSDSNL